MISFGFPFLLHAFLSVLWHCWFSDFNRIWPVKPVIHIFRFSAVERGRNSWGAGWLTWKLVVKTDVVVILLSVRVIEGRLQMCRPIRLWHIRHTVHVDLQEARRCRADSRCLIQCDSPSLPSSHRLAWNECHRDVCEIVHSSLLCENFVNSSWFFVNKFKFVHEVQLCTLRIWCIVFFCRWLDDNYCYYLFGYKYDFYRLALHVHFDVLGE